MWPSQEADADPNPLNQHRVVVTLLRVVTTVTN